VLYPKSPRAVTPGRAAELASRLPPFITPVLLFVNEDAPKVIACTLAVKGAIAQFHGDETPEQCEEPAARAAFATCAPPAFRWGLPVPASTS
jgi:phosphoribosylanthranilate isomerase